MWPPFHHWQVATAILLGVDMIAAYIGLALGWTLLSLNILNYVKRLKLEISYLPEPAQQTKTVNHSVGMPIHDAIELPDVVKDTYAVLLVSSPTCHPCHEALAEFLKENRSLQIPFVCLAEADQADYFEKFRADYSKWAEIVPLKEAVLKRLGITRFPTFFVIDPKGVIQREFLLVHFLVKYVEQIRVSLETGGKDGQ